MAFLTSSRRHSSHLLLLRLLSTTTTTTTISASTAKNKLRNVFDPDKALSILSSTSPSSSSSSYRFALDLTVRRLARSRRFPEIQTLLEAHRSKLSGSPDESSIAPLILTYGSAGMLSHARSLFDEIPGPSKTSVSFNALLSACIKSKNPALVPALFRDLPSLHPSVVPDCFSYGILIKSLCLSGKLDAAFDAFREMRQQNKKEGLPPPSVAVYTTLIDSSYKKGRPEDAARLWEEMLAEGLQPDHVAYNVRMMYSSQHGTPEEVEELIRESESAGWRPDAISYNYLLNCYCRNGRFEEAKEAYRGFLKRRKAEPNAAMFKDLLKFLCENGDFDGGLEVWRGSMRHNRIPDFRTTKVLAEGLVERGKAEEAKEVIRVVKERFPENLVRGWKSLEEQLGLAGDGAVAETSETG